jgi:hypothetical protein
VSINDAAAVYPRFQHGPPFGKEAGLQAIDAPDQRRRKSEPRIEERHLLSERRLAGGKHRDASQDCVR